MKHRHLIALVAITMIALTPTSHAHADMAPPEPPAGGSLDTGQPSTYVRMVSEDVLMIANDDNMDVKAIFNMLNQGTKDEILDARFPVGFKWDSYPIWGVNTDSFVVYVDRKRTTFVIDDQPDSIDIWASWQVAFPPGETVKVEVVYQTLKSESDSFSMYNYTLETGAGWYGTIGEGTVTLRMPYEIDKDSLYHTDIGWLIVDPEYYKIVGTDIIWHFTDLEPKQEDNIFVKVISPPLWREWTVAQNAVKQNPDSVSAHLRLARAMSEITDYHNGYCYGLFEFGQKAIDEYTVWLNVIPDNIVRQKIPNIVDYHLDYLELSRSAFFEAEPICPEFMRIMALAPTDKRVLELKEQFDRCISEATSSPTATFTATPSPTQTLRPTRTPRPTWTPSLTPTLTFTLTPKPTLTITPILTATSTPTPIPEPRGIKGLQIGILVAMVVMVIAEAGVGVWAARRTAAGARRDIP